MFHHFLLKAFKFLLQKITKRYKLEDDKTSNEFLKKRRILLNHWLLYLVSTDHSCFCFIRLMFIKTGYYGINLTTLSKLTVCFSQLSDTYEICNSNVIQINQSIRHYPIKAFATLLNGGLSITRVSNYKIL